MNFTVGFSNEIKALKKQYGHEKRIELNYSDFLFQRVALFLS